MCLKNLNVSKCIRIYQNVFWYSHLLLSSVYILCSSVSKCIWRLPYVSWYFQMYLNIFEVAKCIPVHFASEYFIRAFLLRCFHCQSVPSHLMISTRKIVLGTKKKKSFVHNCPTSKDFLSSFSLSTLPLTTTKTRRRKNDTTKWELSHF